MRELIDTNIILDALMIRKPFNDSAEKIFLLAAGDKIAVFITVGSITDIFYILWNRSLSLTYQTSCP